MPSFPISAQAAKHPLLVIGAGANRKMTSNMLRQLVDSTGLPFCDTQMGKGVIDSRAQPLSSALVTKFIASAGFVFLLWTCAGAFTCLSFYKSAIADHLPALNSVYCFSKCTPS
jgi:hypothetical protein